MSVNGYAVGTDGDGVHLWKTATRKRVGKLVEGTSASAWILPDGKALVSLSLGKVELWDWSTLTKKGELPRPKGPARNNLDF